MSAEQGLITAFILNGQGGGRELSFDDIDQWTPEQGVLWVHFDYTDKQTVQWLNQKSQLPAHLIKGLLADEPRPRTVVENNGLLVFLRGVNLNPGQDPEDMVSVRLWIEDNRIISTRHRQILSIRNIYDALLNNQGPRSSIDFLTMLTTRLTDRMAEVIDQLQDSVDNLDELVLTQESYLLRPKISDLRREATVIRRYLAPQREALSRLVQSDITSISSLQRNCLREDLDRVVRYIEDLDSARDRAAITQEELVSRLSEQMERRMYILSIVTVIFLPLGFVTGMLGINVGGLPGTDYSGSFWIVSGILGVVALFILGLLHRYKWI